MVVRRALCLFPNPRFDKDTERRWGSIRFYSDPAYFTDPKLIRPYKQFLRKPFIHIDAIFWTRRLAPQTSSCLTNSFPP